MDFSQHFAAQLRRLLTPQREPIPGTTQVPNSAGGYAWAVDRWARLDRFLVLGTEGGTFYIGERQLTREAAISAVECVAEDGPRTVRRIVEISVAGRASSNDPALFALAIAAGLGDRATKAAAWTALPQVARTGTHLFHWLRYVRAFRGWGRGVRRAVAGWYTGKPAEQLGYQVLKYRSRDGWSHRDALRLAHPKAPSVAHDLIFRFATKGWGGVLEIAGVSDLPVVQMIEAVQALRHQAPREAARTIARYSLTRKMVPTELLAHAEVWEALLERMPITAMLRNLSVMSRVGLLVPLGDTVPWVLSRRGMRGAGQWTPVPQIVDALDAAFYLAFEHAPPTGRRTMLALDVSGSMVAAVHGLPYLSCREASAAMAMVTAAREPSHMVTAFTDGSGRSRWPGLGSGLTPLAISPGQRLDAVVAETERLTFGGTDCALPMLEAMKHRWPVDLFVIYTDSETWAGRVHPAQALRRYRERLGIPARLVVVGMASNGFTIADPQDPGMLDVVGFDAATPAVIAEFAVGA